MRHTYVVLGAGMQGTAAGYDLARFGAADRVILANLDATQATAAAERINRLLGHSCARAVAVDVTDRPALIDLLRGADAVVNAVPYRFNLTVTQAAIEAKVNLCDLGGNTEIVFQQLTLDEQARDAGVTVVPDCGVMPGMGNLLAVHGMVRLSALGATCRDVRVYAGGLPQTPRPPLDYKLVFNIEGVLDIYTAPAQVLRGGKVVRLDPLTECESVEFAPPVGRCEAFITSGGVSTCPWTFAATLDRYEEKTVRYPGHLDKVRAMAALGLLSVEPVAVRGASISPRDVFCRVVAPRIDFPDDKDLLVLRVICSGRKDGRPAEVVYDLLDFHDEQTGFSAMERTTGFSASIVAILLAEKVAAKGVLTPERVGLTEPFIAELARRGFDLTETVRLPIPSAE